MIEEILEYNRKFVEEKGYEPYVTSKYPEDCNSELYGHPAYQSSSSSTGIKERRCKMIKNAGGVITHPYGSVVRSLLVGILELGVEEVMVVGHTDCGVQGMNPKVLLKDLEERGVEKKHIDIIRNSGIDLEGWLAGFDSVEQSVEDTVFTLRNHPLMPRDVRIYGFIMDSITGELKKI